MRLIIRLEVVYFGVLMDSGISNAPGDKSHADNSSKETALDSKNTGTLLVSQLPGSDVKTVQLVLAQPSSSQQLGGSGPGRPPVVITSVSSSEQAKKSSLVAKLTQSSGEHLTGGQVAKICASTPQMSNTVSAGSGKPKAFATLMGSGDNAASTTVTPKKQSSSKKGTLCMVVDFCVTSHVQNEVHAILVYCLRIIEAFLPSYEAAIKHRGYRCHVGRQIAPQAS